MEIEYKGKTYKNWRALSRDCNISAYNLKTRVEKGMTLEEAMLFENGVQGTLHNLTSYT